MIELLNKLRILLPPALKWQAVLLLVLMILAAFLELAGLAMLMPAVMAFPIDMLSPSLRKITGYCSTIGPEIQERMQDALRACTRSVVCQ